MSRPDAEGNYVPLFKVARESKKARRRIRAVSEKRAEAKPWTDAIRARVFDRDGGCVLHEETPWPCGGGLEPHHRRKAIAGGAYSLTNLVTTCHEHNRLIEDEADWFRTHKPWFVVREGDEEWHRLGTNRRERGAVSNETADLMFIGALCGLVLALVIAFGVRSDPTPEPRPFTPATSSAPVETEVDG